MDQLVLELQKAKQDVSTRPGLRLGFPSNRSQGVTNVARDLSSKAVHSCCPESFFRMPTVCVSESVGDHAGCMDVELLGHQEIPCCRDWIPFFLK